jgi:hypothetical protein
VDVAASKAALVDIWTRVLEGTPCFALEPDGKIAYDAPQGFRLHVDLIEIGGWGDVRRIHAPEPLFDGFVAFKSDLLLLRAVTVVNRGRDGDILDFLWLLSEVAKEDPFPVVDEEELEHLCSAMESCLGKIGCLVVAAMIGSSNEAAAMRLLA